MGGCWRRKKGYAPPEPPTSILMVPLGPRLDFITSCRPLAALMFMKIACVTSDQSQTIRTSPPTWRRCRCRSMRWRVGVHRVCKDEGAHSSATHDISIRVELLDAASARHMCLRCFFPFPRPRTTPPVQACLATSASSCKEKKLVEHTGVR